PGEAADEDAEPTEELRDHDQHGHRGRHALLGEGLDGPAPARPPEPAEHLLRPVGEEDHAERDPDDGYRVALRTRHWRHPRRRDLRRTSRACQRTAAEPSCSLTPDRRPHDAASGLGEASARYSAATWSRCAATTTSS